jgi:predicted phosphodiesterase
MSEKTDIQKALNRELIDELKERGYFVSKVPKTVSGKTFEADFTKMAGRKYRFGVLSCSHLGSKYQQLSHLYTFYKLCKRRRIAEVLHCGDLVDGEKMYRGQEYELFLHGADAQTQYAVDNYPKFKGIKTRVIMGNHDESFWKHSGFNVVEAVCRERDDMEYLGDYLAYMKVDGLDVAIMHGSGGVAYARSYKLQKIIEQMSPEKKPHMLFVGHWHIVNHLPAYRNVEGFSMGAFQAQTPYLVRKGLTPNIGGILVEIRVDDSGILSVKTEWVPFYVPKKNDF